MIETKQTTIPNNETPKEETTEDIYTKVKSVVEESKKATEELRKLIQEKKEIEARELLSGKTNNALQQPSIKEETPLEYTKRILKGQI